MDLRLDAESAALLRELLDRELRDTRMEIAHTDTSTFKQTLRDREARVRVVLDQLGGPLPDPV